MFAEQITLAGQDITAEYVAVETVELATNTRLYNPAFEADRRLTVAHPDTLGCSHIRPCADSDTL